MLTFYTLLSRKIKSKQNRVSNTTRAVELKDFSGDVIFTSVSPPFPHTRELDVLTQLSSPLSNYVYVIKDKDNP